MVRDPNFGRDVGFRMCRNKFINLLITSLHTHYKCIKSNISRM